MPKADLSRERVQGLPGQRVGAIASVRPAYISAPAISGGSELRELASSLSSFAPGLNRLAARSANAKIEAKEKMTKEEKERMEALANSTLASMTLKEANAAVADGSLPEYDNPFFKAATDKIRGVRTAREEGRAIRERIASGEIDPLSDDFEALITQGSEDTLEGAGDHFVSGYHGAMFQERENILAAQSNAKIAQAETDRASSAHTVLRDVILNGTPEEASAQLSVATGEVKGTLNLSFGEQDEIILGIAAEVAATGDHARVEAILKTARTGQNGQNLGSISSKKGYGAKTEALIQKAKNIAEGDKAEKDYSILMEYDDMIANGTATVKDIREDTRLTGADQRSLSNKLIAADQKRLNEAKEEAKVLRQERATRSMEMTALSMVNSGTGFMIEDMELEVDGKTVKMTASEATKFGVSAAVNQRMAALDKQFGGDVPAGMKEEAIQKIVNQNATTYEPWENLLNSVSATSTFANTAGQDGFPPQLTAAMDLYRNLDRTTAEQHIKDDASKDLLRAAYVAEKYMGMGAEGAMAHAISVRESNINGQGGVQAKNVNKAFKNLDLKKWFPGEGPKDSYQGYAFRDINEMAIQIAKSTGVNAETAINEAAEIYASSHVIVNGAATRIPAGFTAPQFKKTAQGFLKAWHDKHNKDIFGVGSNNADWGSPYEDINMRSVDGGKTFQIFEGITPLGPRHTYTANNFRRYMAEEQTHEDDKKREKAAKTADKLKTSRQRVRDHVKENDIIPKLSTIR